MKTDWRGKPQWDDTLDSPEIGKEEVEDPVLLSNAKFASSEV